MSKIIPFCAVRPSADRVEEVVSHPVDAYSKEAINSILATRKNSFLQIVFAKREVKNGGKSKLEAIKEKFLDFQRRKILERDGSPCLYLYRQIKNEKSHTGIIALGSIEDYEKDVIRIHEHTLEKRVEKLKDYLNVCDFNAEPVSIAYPNNKELAKILETEAKRDFLYDFTSDSVHHTIWRINSKADIEKIVRFFHKIPFLYIADGHHRVASSVLLAQMKRKKNKKHTGKEPYNFFLAAFFAEEELSILNFNRACTTLNGLSPTAFFKKIVEYFYIYPKGKKVTTPTSTKEIGMYLHGQWYLLKMKEKCHNSNNPVDMLDVSVLSDKVFNSILKITNLRNDSRITFVSGNKKISQLKKTVDSGKMKVAFFLHPISFRELQSVADSGGIMPPKSTWIEPKLENGLIIYSLS